jgi:hypothetical protein
MNAPSPGRSLTVGRDTSEPVILSETKSLL